MNAAPGSSETVPDAFGPVTVPVNVTAVAPPLYAIVITSELDESDVFESDVLGRSNHSR